MHIADVTWREKENGTFESGLTVWIQSDEEPAFLPLLPGRKISWEIRGPKRCIGNINTTGHLIRCPENSIILDSGQKCGPCQAVDFADPCIRCDGRRCDAIEARRLQCDVTDYVVYGVIFNDRTLKVGVSSKRRALTRWVEQGADFASILREISGGRTARRVEDRIGRQQGVTKQVRSERKIRALRDKLKIEDVNSILTEFANHTSHLDISSDPQIFDLSDYYSLKDLDTQPKPWRKRSEPIDGKTIIGEIVGMKGSLLVTRIDSSFLVVDLRQIIGFTIDMESDITMVTQTGIMDFF
ncbi:MAG: DUF2797 domain-containing protein [Candidatus Thorarchaeota archaeon]|nr:DUF2797 domain-containing protein [Candidatus Thorarchaeota archaeon]